MEAVSFFALYRYNKVLKQKRFSEQLDQNIKKIRIAGASTNYFM